MSTTPLIDANPLCFIDDEGRAYFCQDCKAPLSWWRGSWAHRDTTTPCRSKSEITRVHPNLMRYLGTQVIVETLDPFTNWLRKAPPAELRQFIHDNRGRLA